MIANTLRELRNEHGLTQKEFAEKFGLSDARYNQYETGKRTPDIETLTLFANYYGVSLDYITGNTHERTLTNKDFIRVGKKIKKLRNEFRYTQTQLGEKLGVGKTTISNYENGNSFPDNEILIKLSQIFNVSTDYLLGISNIRDRTVLTPKDESDIAKTLDVLKEQIENNENGPLNYNGTEVTSDDAELLLDAIEIALRRVKKKNKEKYTPKKYKE